MKFIWFVCGAVVAAWSWYGVAASASSACRSGDVAAYEAALGVRRGGTRVLPQLGFTIQYLGTENRGHGICAVLVRRLD